MKLINKIKNWYKIFYLELHLEDKKEDLDELYYWGNYIIESPQLITYIRRVERIIHNLK